MRSSAVLWPLASSLGLLAEAVPLNSPSVKFISPSKVSPGSAQNVVVEYNGDVDGHLTLTYGACSDELSVAEAHQHVGSTHVGQHPLAKRHLDHQEKRPTRFVWLTSEDISGGCLSAFLDGELIGQSDELDVVKRLARRTAKKKSFADVAGDDSLWFDGVAYLKQKQPDDFFVTATKNKSFGILGGGMSGLLSSLILDSVGIHNWKILESSERIGGRVRTVYLNGQVCYPSWHINSTGPGTMLASYLSDYEATAACAMSEEEHLAYMKNSLIEVHGDVVQENWTGNWVQLAAKRPT
ncbi:hypothetical protein FOQG_10869 [Fusarium oxysporum f. sp. raphani 54005]|uniref:Amine oxidase domain-containing protein n=1 Tax=Fusarium oxysporum f. sp. raphani 54005 TaxID=1089458 RepID=X0C240_FUSOX|nr:hypothetical protein FOQG_10869 [Fusarium oxysporum f. sp. raphani 54005]